MKKLLLTVSIALLLIVQNTVLAADIHIEHQNGTQHLEIDHDHDIELTNAEFSSDSDLFELECDHCCHCHGSVGMAIMSFRITSSIPYTPIHIDTASIDLVNGVSSSPFRPPITYSL